MDNLEILFNLLIRPNYALRREDRSLSLAIMVVIAAVWSAAVSNYLVKGVSVNAAIFSLSIILPIIITLFAIVVTVSLWHFVSESFKGEGKASELFICICLSFLPYIFLIPMALIMKFSRINITFQWLFLKFFIAIWVIALQISSLKIVYELNGPLATLTYFVPFLVIFAIFLLIVTLTIVFLVAVASQALTPFLQL